MLVLSAIGIYADGIPLTADRSKLSIEHFVLQLTDKQIDTIGRARYISLTPYQKKILNNKNLPSKIIVLTPSYRDCTCGIDIFAYWNKLGEVMIGKFYVTQYKKGIVQEYEQDKNSIWIGIIIDAYGNLYYNEQKVSTKGIGKLIDKSIGKVGSKNVSITFNYPVKINDAITRKINESVKIIRAYSKSKGIDVAMDEVF